MIAYQIALAVKFLAVSAYAGGLVAAFVASSLPERKRAVHLVASPALLLTWCAGFALSEILHVRWTEAWILGGLALSTLSQMALAHSVSKRARSGGRTWGHFLAAAVPFALVVVLMIVKPTWSSP